MTRRHNRMQYDLVTKHYLKQESIKALPPALRAHAEVKQDCENIESAKKYFRILPVWDTPPLDDPSIVYETMPKDQKAKYDRGLSMLPPAEPLPKGEKPMSAAKRRQLKKETHKKNIQMKKAKEAKKK